MSEFTTHWDSRVVAPVEPWVLALLDAGDTLAQAADQTSTDAQGWQAALAQAPSDVLLGWRTPDVLHPAN